MDSTACRVHGRSKLRAAEDGGACGYQFQEKEALDTANTLWWQQFQDPVLDELIVEALAHNKGVQIAAANVEQAAAVLTEAKSPLYPQAGYSANGTKERVSESQVPLLKEPRTSYETIVGASWNWTFGAESGGSRKRRGRTCSRHRKRGAA